MRKLMTIIFLLGLLPLTGCATVGNFAAAPVTFNQTMAVDATNQLSVVYPPAYTRFIIKQPTNDAFGFALVQNLRLKGYAVQEAATRAGSQATAPEFNLAYVVDEIDALHANFYRVTLLVGNQSLSQLYQVAADGSLSVAGTWVRKE